MKSKKTKKSLDEIRTHVPGGTIDPQKGRRILAGANPWLDGP